MARTPEYWKIIEEFPNFEVSNKGNVKNRETGRILKQTINGGYPQVSIPRDRGYAQRKVHRLVAEAFVGGKIIGGQVLHIDKDITNPRAENLKWVLHGDIRDGAQNHPPQPRRTHLKDY
jgi:NUMOD4 motif/HNH endonuclease